MYELSVHLNIAHNSFALVRVLRAGAFCLFQFIFERSNKEPSPERVRSERGREDKPLTPVLYSTREGGELYGAKYSHRTMDDSKRDVSRHLDEYAESQEIRQIQREREYQQRRQNKAKQERKKQDDWER